MKPKQAISGTVTGNDQHVGFRAMIMKQAIAYNLAGFAKNLPNDVVSFTLQGDAERLEPAVAAIDEGTKKSSNIKVTTAAAAVDPSLNAFTIFAWTSTTRNITNPYDLVFKLRPDDHKISGSDVKDAWHGILKSTLKGDDLKKLSPDD
jgi:acylphosphatase